MILRTRVLSLLAFLALAAVPPTFAQATSLEPAASQLIPKGTSYLRITFHVPDIEYYPPTTTNCGLVCPVGAPTYPYCWNDVGKVNMCTTTPNPPPAPRTALVWDSAHEVFDQTLTPTLITPVGAGQTIQREVDVTSYTATSDWIIFLQDSCINFGACIMVEPLNACHMPIGSTCTEVRLTVKTPGAFQPTFGKAPDTDGTVRAQVALGTVFDIGLVTPPRQFLDPVVDLLGLQTVTSSNVTPPPHGETLFPTDVVLALGGASAQATRTFAAVHLGTTRIQLLPTAAPIAPVNVDLTVVAPPTLGDSFDNQPDGFDAALVTTAHNRGIPPEYLKGQVAQESPDGSTLRLTNYRYEPCSIDFGSVSRGDTIIDDDPYHLYKLEDARGVTLHEGTPDDLDPRNVYSIDLRDANGNPVLDAHNHQVYRRLTDTDRDITARRIWEANDSNSAATHQNWSAASNRCSHRQEIANDPSLLDFVAQTPVAASYGIFQMLYTTAIDEGWEGVTPDTKHLDQFVQAPKYLFDLPENLLINGGSIQIGTTYDVKHYRRLQASSALCHAQETYPTTLPDFAGYEHFLQKMFQSYNCYEPGYGSGVLDFARSFAPSMVTPVFP